MNRRNRRAKRKATNPKHSASKPDILRDVIIEGLDGLIGADWGSSVAPTTKEIGRRVFASGDPLVMEIIEAISVGCEEGSMDAACEPMRVSRAIGRPHVDVVRAMMRMCLPDWLAFEIMLVVDGRPSGPVSARAVLAATTGRDDAIAWNFLPQPWLAFNLGMLAMARSYRRDGPVEVADLPIEGDEPQPLPRVGSRRRALLDTLAQRPLSRRAAPAIGGANGMYWLVRSGFAAVDGDTVTATEAALRAMVD